uniref:Putative secreted protein n=1 Tax=Ixodes ricinus TaxID=34613 RepID=A0A090XET2_IXORI
MQPASAFVAVCSILAMHLPSPAESTGGTNGKADDLFQFLKSLQDDEVLYTVKRSYKKNLKANVGESVLCVESTKIDANETDARLCTVFKTDQQTGDPFEATYTKTDDNTILGNPGSHKITVLYVNQEKKCFLVEMGNVSPKAQNPKACDLLSTNLNTECETQFKTMCGSQTEEISTKEGCKGLDKPVCHQGS